MPRPTAESRADAVRDLLSTVRNGDELVNVCEAVFAVAAALNYRGKKLANAVEALAAADHSNRVADALAELAKQVGRVADALHARTS
jgi:hypothetical protein